MRYGFKNKEFPLFINGQELKSTESERVLGVIISKNLMFKIQFISCVSKANQTMGITRKSFAHLDYKLLRSHYVTFIRPLLEFDVPVLSPALKCD